MKNYLKVSLLATALFMSGKAWAFDAVNCTIKDSSLPLIDRRAPKKESIKKNAEENRDVVLEVFANDHKQKDLRDKRFIVKAEIFVDQVSIILIDAATRKQIVMAHAPSEGFTQLSLETRVPNVKVSCVPAPAEPKGNSNGEAVPTHK